MARSTRPKEYGKPGQADRAAEVDALIARAQDPNDEFDGSDEAAQALLGEAVSGK